MKLEGNVHCSIFLYAINFTAFGWMNVGMNGTDKIDCPAFCGNFSTVSV